MNNEQSDFRDLQFVDLKLQNGQVELILRSMELYGYNLKFMVNDTDITTEERSRKQAKNIHINKFLQLKQNKSIIKQIFIIPIQRWLKIC